MIIGITGSSGAGKSTVCEILEEYQIKVLNADKMAKQLSKKGNEYLTDIVTLFGEEILQENGELDRPKLANIIYNNEEKRELLNQCTFKHIHIAIQKEIQRIFSENPKAVIAIDAPLLFEAKLEDICNLVIAVIAKDEELQIERIIQRDCITREQAIKRLQAQMPDEFYTSKSQYVIVNDGKIEDIEEQIKEVIENITL
ncbi:MAG: dephospho-CoA kinase [Clostridia bacterium]|nr:dephospho-CoA kinase [Clostridia bacterium]